MGATTRLRRTIELVRMLAPRDLRIRYRQSVLDLLWALITPVVTLVVYGLVLTRSFDVDASCSPYFTSAWAGMVVWTFFASAVGGAVVTLVGASSLVTKLYFPREALPLAVVVATLADLAIGAVTLIVLVVVDGPGLGPMALAAILPLAVVVVWAAAIGVLAAALAVFVRDVVHGVGLALRVGFFATPVMYESQFLPAVLAWTAWASPLAVSIDGVRATMLCGTAPDWGLLGIHLVLGLGLLVGSIWYTASVESRIADLV